MKKSNIICYLLMLFFLFYFCLISESTVPYHFKQKISHEYTLLKIMNLDKESDDYCFAFLRDEIILNNTAICLKLNKGSVKLVYWKEKRIKYDLFSMDWEK